MIFTTITFRDIVVLTVEYLRIQMFWKMKPCFWANGFRVLEGLVDLLTLAGTASSPNIGYH
jgi:hypothetical protein